LIRGERMFPSWAIEFPLLFHTIYRYKCTIRRSGVRPLAHGRRLVKACFRWISLLSRLLVPSIWLSMDRPMETKPLGGWALFPLLSALSLAACGTGEASSAPGSTHSNRVQTQIQPDSSIQPARIRAIARSDRDSPACGVIDGMQLVVLEGNREVSREYYCSAYSRGRASLVTDARGEHYVLLQYSEGRGTRATTDHLRIYRLSDNDLDERADLEVRRAVGVSADQVYNYRAEAVPGGGLVVTGAWTIEGPRYEIDPEMPDRRQTIIAVDTAPEVPILN
jgi:hypothetical protein